MPAHNARFDRMREILAKAEGAIGAQKALEHNRDAAKELMFGFLEEFAGLVDHAGGDSLYIPNNDYLAEDIDHAFIDAIEQNDARQPKIDSRQYSTLSHRQQGLSVRGATL